MPTSIIIGIAQAAKVSVNSILRLEICDKEFFSVEGNKIERESKAWETDTDGQKWVHYNGKRCMLKSTLQACKGPIPYRRSGRS